MKEYRCKFCKKLLFKYMESIGQLFEIAKDVAIYQDFTEDLIEIKCPKCKKINKFTVKQPAKV